MYVCLCKGITDSQINQAIDDGASSMRDIVDQLGVATQCGKCGQCAKQLVNERLYAIAEPSEQFYALAS